MLRRFVRAGVSRLRPPAGPDADFFHSLKNDVVHSINELAGQNEAVHRSITDQYGLVSQRLQQLERTLEARLGALEQATESRADTLSALNRSLEVMTGPAGAPPMTSVELTPHIARLLNRASSADGPLREHGVFFNTPTTVTWHAGEARHEQINERIIEVPYVLQKAATLDGVRREVDIGGGESTVGLSLASLGLDTVVVEPRGMPFTHPNLTIEARNMEDVDKSAPFDMAILLSTIEHIGVGAYANELIPDQDFVAMANVRDLVRSDGHLVLTTPFGPAGEDDLQRTYDADRLCRLLRGWNITDLMLIQQTDPLTWERDATPLDDPALFQHTPSQRRRVILVTASKAEDPEYVPTLV